ncbi:hypothetical protein DMN91_011157 [Ooceraea biroi]|uniref:U5 small nuclear ribonucleoprotein TSSC4 n=1 Tax=Ooceraea biroi TaxID=2015173 RepID=A0A026WW23_OOCBI|nr:protein TSSC4 [Ooceraea biroi]XP_011352659.1 protein TSSC4 [Ooceraea biroi]EZA60280.1 Protein TSSC4 [Ooceraea biroi]RLU17088.1 hypothetical protein DMN91_011157 [Ooceraea biroi]
MHTSANFVLRGGCAAFADKQKMLFDQLLIAESKCNKHDSPNVDDVQVKEMNERDSVCRDNWKQKRETKRFRGKESIFSRPEGPAPRARCKNIPDFRKNPRKWTRYSLDDVSNEDMTEQSNTQAALSFLKELKARKKKEEADHCREKMDVESEETRFKSRKHTSTSEVMFKKPQATPTPEDSEAVVVEPDDRPVFKSSKIILPEYQVGQRPKKVCKQNRPIVKVDRSKELKLDHLTQLEEEDE